MKIFLLPVFCVNVFAAQAPWTQPEKTFFFNHIGLSVANISTQSNFYKNVMGFEHFVHNYTLQQPNTIHVVQLQNNDGVMIELIDNVSSTRLTNHRNLVDGSKFQGYFHWALQVQDLNATFAALTEAGTGARAVSTPAADMFGKGGRFAYVADPEGNLIELLQPPPSDAAEKPGLV